MGILKAAAATSGGVASVATPTTFAVINHNKNVSITKDFEQSVKKNEELTQENQEMNE